MRRMYNKETISGYLFSHELELKTVQNEKSDNYGKEFIQGKINIATDDDCLNVITVEFTYVTEVTKKGGKNATFAVLKGIIDKKYATVTDSDKDNATMLKCETALGLNDWYDKEDRLISLKINSGGFVTVVTHLDPEPQRNFFKTDILITKVDHVDKDEEKKVMEDYTSVRGAVFDFRNAILPVEFKVKNPDGIKYFENLEVSGKEPILTQVWGNIIATTIADKQVTESAFGGDEAAAVTTTDKKVRDWVITGCLKNPYDYGDDEVCTEQDIVKAMQDRETMLADKKKQREDYLATRDAKGGDGPTPAATAAKAGGFNF